MHCVRTNGHPATGQAKMIDQDDTETLRIAKSIGARLLGVCIHLTSADYAGLCLSMARAQIRGEKAAAAEWPVR